MPSKSKAESEVRSGPAECVLSQISNPNSSFKVTDPQQLEHLHGLMSRTALHGESNSVMIVGPRGSGKTMLVKQSVQKLFSDTATKDLALVVELNGLLQTDDNIGLEEITRQLHLDNVVEDTVHGSFAERLQYLLQSLRSGSRETRPVIFIIDEFDLFTNHKNQTLLYNLYDISQTKQTPVCVVGLTCRIDFLELLEKRVKSRFSHRLINMYHKLGYPELLEILQNYLTLPSNRNALNSAWNKRVNELLESIEVADGLKFRFSMFKDMNYVKKIAQLAVGRCHQRGRESLLDMKDFLEAFTHLDVDSRSSVLSGISILELCLAISMKQLQTLYQDEPFNFQMVYEHYKKFAEKKSSMRLTPKSIAMKAFEHLIDLELIKPVDNSNTHLKEYRPMRFLVESAELDEALLSFKGCPSDIRQWAATNVIDH